MLSPSRPPYFSSSIVEYIEEKNPDFSTYHSYKIVVNDDSGHRWYILKRFSDFYNLHEQLKRQRLPANQRDYLARFPFPSRLRGRLPSLSSKEDICKERQSLLNNYIQSVSSFEPLPLDLVNFLDLAQTNSATLKRIVERIKSAPAAIPISPLSSPLSSPSSSLSSSTSPRTTAPSPSTRLTGWRQVNEGGKDEEEVEEEWDKNFDSDNAPMEQKYVQEIIDKNNNNSRGKRQDDGREMEWKDGAEGMKEGIISEEDGGEEVSNESDFLPDNVILVKSFCMALIAAAIRAVVSIIYFIVKGQVTLKNALLYSYYLYRYIFTLLEGAGLVFVVWLYAHRFLGWVVTHTLYRKLGMHKPKGSFIMEFGWVSLRVGLDLNELIISDFVWKNPPGRYPHSPYFLKISSCILRFNASSVLRAIYDHRESIIIENLEIENIEGMML